MTRVEWSGGKSDLHPYANRACCAAELGDICLWVEGLREDPEKRYVWTADVPVSASGRTRTLAAGVARTEAQARRAAESAARALSRPRLRLVHAA